MMTRLETIVHPGALSAQLAWFARLRWLAGASVILAAAIDLAWLGWLEHAAAILGLGLGIVGYNVVLVLALRWIVRLEEGKHRWLIRHAWFQIVLDLACLTLLVVWSRGLYSPLIGFYVFHMVFASLLLPRRMGYAGTAVAGSLLAAGLVLTEQWPAHEREVLMLVGLLLTLVLTVYLVNTLTASLRQQRRRLILQNRRIRAITGQLRRQQQAMIQHEKMVAMGHMVAGITHEIANPLASMDSLLQLIQRKPERMNEKTLATLREQVARVHRIVQEMKQFARPADGQLQTVPLNDAVQQALEVLRYDKRLGRVEVRQELSPTVGSITLLPQALEQVLINLIQNALDAMEPVQGEEQGTSARPALTVRTERREGWCIVEVSDTGHGIPPEHIERLFEPFFTTKPVGHGTGLGLSISYSLVQKLGGSISVRSRVGEGTTFTIRLPAARTPTELEAARSA
jgi:signal transduction histidine kinase